MPTLTFPTDDQTTALVAAIGLPNEEVQVRLSGFESSEAVSQLYRYELNFTLPDVVDVTDLVGAPVSIGLRARIDSSQDPQERYFHGVINRFSYLGEIDSPGRGDGSASVYKAEIVPPIWFLTQTSSSRILQEMTIPEIVQQILGEHNIDWEDRLSGTYTDHTYRVQYKETDFDFVSRLLEEAGIYYYFQPDDSGTQLVLSDGLTGWFACDEDTLTYGGSSAHVQSWQHNYQYLPTDYVHRDFNFEQPAEAVAAAISSLRQFPRAPVGRFFDAVGGFLENAIGDAVARLRMEELEATSETIHGTTRSPCAIPGATFSLSSHPHADENDVEQCFKSVQFKVEGVTGSLQGAFKFACRFTCFPSETQFRPPRTTRRPTMPGPQSATVTGNQGDTITTDEYGRVKVQFHWDEEGQRDESSSCWIRVSQSWAGNGYGSVLLPHVGQEVIVSFLEGDPDRPVVTGRVYNSDHMPPETLPDKKQRAIVAWDHAGNYIALDADEERVDINNASDKFEYTVGTSASATLGLDFAITIGCGVAINVGASVGIDVAGSYAVSAGWSTSLALGGSIGATFGSSFTYAKGNFVNAGDSLGQIAFQESADFVSQERVRIVGGSGTNNSVIKADSTSILLSYGTTSAAFKNVTAKDVAKATLLTSALGTAGIGGTAAASFMAGSAAEADDATALAVLSGVTGVAGVTAAAAAAVLTATFAKKWRTMQQANHPTTAPAFLKLSSTGVSAIANSPGVVLIGGPDVIIAATTSIAVQSPATTITGDLTVTGMINGVNIQDLGPSQAAAGGSAAAGVVGADNGEIAADVAVQEGDNAAAIVDAEAEVGPGA